MFTRLFNPRTIAVIGASSHRKKLGYVIYHNIRSTGFRGRVVPINISGGTIKSQRILKSVQSFHGAIDVAIIVVPAPIVPIVLQECGKKKIPFAIIISAGFGEGGAEGKIRERHIVAIAKKFRIRMIGPNCLGILVPGQTLNASFAQGLPKDGNVVVISQSGAMAVAINDWAVSTGLGFRALISLGNSADIGSEELLRFFDEDKKTKCIIMYLESMKGGRAFVRAVQRVSKRTPVIILKPGKSTEAKHAAASHTGALAGSYEVERAFLQHAGAIVVDTLEELFLYTEIFERPKKLSGKRVAVITNAGGPGILSTDAIIASGLSLAHLSAQTVHTLSLNLPETASRQNPVDVVGDAPPSRYATALQVVLKDPNVDAVLVLLTHQYVTQSVNIARIISRAQRKHPQKQIVTSFIGGSSLNDARNELARGNVPHFPFPNQAIRALQAQWIRINAQTRNFKFVDAPMLTPGTKTYILGRDAERIASRYFSIGISSYSAKNSKEAERHTKKIKFPITAKLISTNAIHKTEKGFVAINIMDMQELRRKTVEWYRLIRNGSAECILLQPHVRGAIELFIGGKRDPVVGPYIVFGLGGIFVESLKLTEIIPVPITQRQAENIVRDGVLREIFNSKRGKKLPIREIARVLTGIARLLQSRKDIQEIDCNPVIVAEKKLHVVDIRLTTMK